MSIRKNSPHPYLSETPLSGAAPMKYSNNLFLACKHILILPIHKANSAFPFIPCTHKCELRKGIRTKLGLTQKSGLHYCATYLCSLALLMPDSRCTTFFLMIVIGGLTDLMMGSSAAWTLVSHGQVLCLYQEPGAHQELVIARYV